MGELPKALVACCECGNLQILVRLVARCGLNPMVVTTTNDAVAILGDKAACVGFCQADLPGDGFKAVLKEARRVAVPLVVSSRPAHREHYLESMRLGAFDFICPPYYHTEVAALAMAMMHRRRRKIKLVQ